MRVCGENLSLQLYQPKVLRGRMPVVLVIHSGGWQNGSRLEMPELSRSLAALGYTVSSIDYGLAPQSQFPGPIEDIRGALAFLREHEKEWSLDLRRVVLLGRSAGAQIALSAPVANDPIKGLKGVIAFYGPNDLRLAWTIPGSRRIIDSRRLLRQYLGGSPADVPQIYDEASPLYRVGPNFPPTLMIHGGRDELVWPLHQKRLSQRLTKFSVPHVYVELPWATHGCDYFFSGPCGRISTYAIKRYLANVLPLSEG
jgi:acetyl esterase/lipase